LQRPDGSEVYVAADLVLGLWPHEGGTRLWSLACGCLDVRGSAARVADDLDLEYLVQTPEEVERRSE
jgi:hypothetical protein